MRGDAKARLQFVADQCPLPWCPVPSLHHTRWYAEWQNLPGTYTLEPDGYTVTVFKTRLVSWYRSFTDSPPVRPPQTSLLTFHEWLPRYQLLRTPGWHRFGNVYTWAYAKLHPEYLKDWNQQARRHLKVFQKSGARLRLGTKADVEQVYAVSQVPKHMQKSMLDVLDKQLATHPETIDILVAEKSGQAIACYVAGHCDEAKLSEYIIGAFHPHFAKDQAMVGLIDWWYQRALARGHESLTFGHMEAPGRLPASGDGYSVFKTNFGVQRWWLPINHWRVYFSHKWTSPIKPTELK